MYLYVELWKPKPAWRALSAQEREQFIAGTVPALEELGKAGVEIVGFALNDPDTAHRADYVYMAAWRMPSRELAVQLERAVIDYGFHEYFEQVNARGEIRAPEAVLGHMRDA